MKLPQSAGYAVEALTVLARARAGEEQPVAVIAEGCRLPPRFVRRVLKVLTAARILHSRRGPEGGYCLARPPEQITLLEVIEVVGGPIVAEMPLTGAEMSDRLGGPMAVIWGEAVKQVRRRLQRVTIADLAAADEEHRRAKS